MKKTSRRKNTIETKLEFPIKAVEGQWLNRLIFNLQKKQGIAIAKYFDTENNISKFLFLDSLFTAKYIQLKIEDIKGIINDPKMSEYSEWAKLHMPMLEKMAKSIQNGTAPIMLNEMPEENFKYLFPDIYKHIHQNQWIEMEKPA